MKPTCRYSFYAFSLAQPPPKNLTTEWPAVEQRQDQHEVRHVGSMGVLLFLFRENKMSTHVIWKYFTKNCGVIFNFSKMVCALPSTLCMTGELWPSRFIWHQDISVTHCQSSAMSFIFTQYSFCNSFRHGIIGWSGGTCCRPSSFISYLIDFQSLDEA